MTAFATSPDIAHYPEHSPFDMDPPLYNLVPEPLDSGQHDTKELLTAALAMAQETNINIFWNMYGTNPLHIYGPDLGHFPWTDDMTPPPLPDITLPEQFGVLKQLINPAGSAILFVVEIDGEERLLKIFSNRSLTKGDTCDRDGRELEGHKGAGDGGEAEGSEDGERSEISDSSEDTEYGKGSGGGEGGENEGGQGDDECSETDQRKEEKEDEKEDDYEDWDDYEWKVTPMDLFERECHAYAHLLRFGACKRGVVPGCYGCTTLSPRDVAKLLAFPSTSDTTRALLAGEGPFPRAILIEYFADAERLSYRNITPVIAQTTLRSLHLIHTAYVSHGDIHARNILLLPDGRVVWIDFDHAACPDSKGSYLVRQDLLGELAEAWDYLYLRLLPDKRIGYAHI